MLIASGPVRAQMGPVAVGGGLTLVGQTTDDDRIRSEAVGSLDAFIDVSVGPTLLHVYLEGNTTPRRGGVSTLVAHANTDAGTALDRRGRGRVQLSEIRLVTPLAADLRLHAGVLDATGFLDVSRIANDENLFFLGSPFVNNPTIAFPDYALGLALDGRPTSDARLRVGVALTSSNGIADNPDVSYGEMLDVTAAGRGVFSGLAVRWVEGGRRLSIGGWLRTDPADFLDGSGRVARDRGLFSVLGWSRAQHSLALRVGVANGRVSPTRAFAGLTYLWARGRDAVGVAAGRSFRSSMLASLDDLAQGEAFLRRRLVGEVFVTLSVQRLENSGFDGSAADAAQGLWIAGTRLSLAF